MLTPEQIIQLSTPTYKIRKEKQKECESLVDPTSVTVLSPFDLDKSTLGASSLNMSDDLSLPQLFFKKEQELEEKWSIRMARLEALLTLGQRLCPHVAFSPVKAPVQHGAPAGALSSSLLSAVPSGQAGPASGLDGTLTTASVEMTSPLENLYPDTDTSEPVFSQPGPVLSFSSGLCQSCSTGTN